MEFRIDQRLRRLRARLRSLYLAIGVARLVCEVLVAMVLAYVLDRWVILPSGVRQVFAVVSLLVLAWRMHRLLWYPLQRALSLKDMALAVEQRYPELDGGLASAVEFRAMGEALPADVSPSLLQRYLTEWDERFSRFPMKGVFQTKGLKRFASAAALLVLAAATFVWLEPAEAAVFVRRLAGSDASWPRRTHLTIFVPDGSQHYRVDRTEDGRPARVIVVRGASLPVEVAVEGRVPSDVFLVAAENGVLSREEEVRMLEGDDDRFSYRFRNVSRSFRLHPRGGDDPGRGQEVSVDVRAPPTVDRIVATTTPPPYTGLAAAREERQDFRGPEGTRVELEIDTSGDVVRGTATFDNDPATELELLADPEAPGRFGLSFVLERSGTLNLHLRSKERFQNLLPLDYVVTSVPDRRPAVEMVLPRVSKLEVTPNAVVPFRMAVSDDYGVARAELVMLLFEDRVVAEELLYESAADARGAGTLGAPLSLFHAFDLFRFQIPEHEGKPAQAAERGQTLSYRIRVADNKQDAARAPAPNLLETVSRSIELVGEGEKIRKLSERQLQIKQTVASLVQSQGMERDALDSVRQGLEEITDTLPKELTALEVNESRLVSKSQQISRELAEVFEEYVLNRLDESPGRDRVLELRLEQLRTRAQATTLDVEGLRELGAAWTDGRFGPLSVLDNLFAMLGLVLDASEVHAARALAALREARLRSGTDQLEELLEQAHTAEGQLIDTYRQLLGKMEEWESFQAILEDWRRLRDDEQDIERRLREQGVKGEPAGQDSGGSGKDGSGKDGGGNGGGR